MKRLTLIAVLLVTLACALAAPRRTLAAKGEEHPAPLPQSAWVAPAAHGDVLRVNLRSAPRLDAPVVARQTIGTPITIFAIVKGTAVEKDNPYWYRITPSTAKARYIYSSYVSDADQVMRAPGKLIVISLSGQWLAAFDHGKYVLDTPVTTGRPDLPTPTGAFHILAKYRDYTFISPWPESSPYYYAPSFTNYAMLFETGGYFIHDAPWRTVYGPGTNLPHHDPGDPLGTHGCVNLPLPAEQALFAWAGVGTTVKIVA